MLPLLSSFQTSTLHVQFAPFCRPNQGDTAWRNTPNDEIVDWVYLEQEAEAQAIGLG